MVQDQGRPSVLCLRNLERSTFFIITATYLFEKDASEEEDKTA